MVSAKKKPGPKPYVPTPAEIDLCEELALVGASKEYIAKRLGISEPTVRKALGERIEAIRQANIGNVARTLYSMANDDRNVAAAIFILKTQASWRENVKTAEESEKITKALGDLIERLPE